MKKTWKSGWQLRKKDLLEEKAAFSSATLLLNPPHKDLMQQTTFAIMCSTIFNRYIYIYIYNDLTSQPYRTEFLLLSVRYVFYPSKFGAFYVYFQPVSPARTA